MTQKSVRFLLAVALSAVPVWSVQAAVSETQPQLAPPSPLSKDKGAPKLTPQQEAALVEVRKILKEARQVAEGITIPEKGIFAKESKQKILQDEKTVLLGNIEEAEFRIGDFSNAAQLWGFGSTYALARAQVRYGKVRDAVRTAAKEDLSDGPLLALVNALIHAGAMQEAITVAEAAVAKEDVLDWRLRKQAMVLSLIARWQYEAHNPMASATLQRAAQTARAMKNPWWDKYYALIHVARAQAVMGNRAASAETFRQASEVVLAIEGGKSAGGLWQVAKVQAEVGDLTASAQTFQQAMQLSLKQHPPTDVNLYGCIAWAQAVSGQREASVKTFQLMLDSVENLPVEKRAWALIEIGKWQRITGEREALAETLERARKANADVVVLAAKAGNLKLAMDLALTTTDAWTQSGALAFLARTLIETKYPFGTPAVFQQLSQSATALLNKPAPKDAVKAGYMLKNIALVQASVGDLATALRTLEMISRDSTVERVAYTELIRLLTTQGKLADARQVAAGRKDEWILAYTGVRRELARLGVRSGDVQGTLAWARKQPGGYAQAYALLGVAEELLDLRGIEDMDKVVPETRARENCPSTD